MMNDEKDALLALEVEQFWFRGAVAGEPITLTTGDEAWPDFFENSPPRPLRQTILHVITATATHAGRLDAARELIDGVQWIVLTR